MANFTAKERGETMPAAGAAEVKKIPEADHAGFNYMGAGRLYCYEHDKHSEADLLRPGYFDSIIDRGAQQYFGALVIYTARGGKKDPEDWQTGIVRFARIRGTRGADADMPTTVAIVQRWHKATLAAHDGKPSEKAA